MSPEKRAELFTEFEQAGEARVRYLLKKNHWKFSDEYRQNASHEWLLIKDAERAALSDAREEESLSISRKALFNSDAANRISTRALHWAASATIWSAIATYIAYVALTAGKP